MYYVIVLTIKKRKESALVLQRILSHHDHLIRARLGLHETKEETHEGLIILHVDAKPESDILINELQATENINAQLVKLD